jgi:hypothetical protein
VVLVGGTNGKGSTCAMLERILLAAGYRVGLYTSPHLLRYNERVRIDGVGRRRCRTVPGLRARRAGARRCSPDLFRVRHPGGVGGVRRAPGSTRS